MYEPLALSTELLDTPEKYNQFVQGFWALQEQRQFKANIKLSWWLGTHGNAHTFLHEAMHFYQDMHGLYFMPLMEEGKTPIILDEPSMIRIVLFNEAWAQTEAIRTSWALMNKGDDLGWRGAIKSKDWAYLAKAYDTDLINGIDEKQAAAKCFERWYDGKHIGFYQLEALYSIIHSNNEMIYKQTGQEPKSEDMRSLTFEKLFERLPKKPKYFDYVDWKDPKISGSDNPKLTTSDNDNIQDIRCGTPPYIWYKLKEQQKSEAIIPKFKAMI